MHSRVSLRVLVLVGLELGGCGSESPVSPILVPQVSFRRLATLPGELAMSNKRDSWSPSGRRLAYESWNGSGYDLEVYDAQNPNSPPLLVHSGDFSRIVSWSPDSQWLLCVMQPEADRFSGLWSLVTFPVTTGATPRVLLSRAAIDWAVWGTDGKIYYWNPTTGQRNRLDPPAGWGASNPGPFPDRPTIIYVWDPVSRTGNVEWFHVLPEEEIRFDYRNPGAEGEIRLVRDVFPDGQRFLALLPTYCGESGIVDAHGRVITKLWSAGCDEPPFEANAVTSDGLVVGSSERDVNDRIVSSILYLADASAAWRVPIENAPQGWFAALSRTGHSLAFETFREDSIYVGDLEISQHGR